MKANGKVAKRYARALFELCAPTDMDVVQKAIEQFSVMLAENKELSVALSNPALPLRERAAVLQDVAKLLAPQAVVGSFFERLLENGRLSAISQIAVHFSQLVDAFRKVKSLEITSAFPIADGEKQDILSQIKRDFGADARISWSVDPEIFGGLTVKAGDVLLDGSVKSRLDRVRTALLQ